MSQPPNPPGPPPSNLSNYSLIPSEFSTFQAQYPDGKAALDAKFKAEHQNYLKQNPHQYPPPPPPPPPQQVVANPAYTYPPGEGARGMTPSYYGLQGVGYAGVGQAGVGQAGVGQADVGQAAPVQPQPVAQQLQYHEPQPPAIPIPQYALPIQPTLPVAPTVPHPSSTPAIPAQGTTSKSATEIALIQDVRQHQQEFMALITQLAECEVRYRAAEMRLTEEKNKRDKK